MVTGIVFDLQTPRSARDTAVPVPLTAPCSAQQVVDEKLWNSEDEEERGDEQGKEKKEEQYDDRGAIAVDDKKDLEYEVRAASQRSVVLGGAFACVRAARACSSKPRCMQRTRAGAIMGPLTRAAAAEYRTCRGHEQRTTAGRCMCARAELLLAAACMWRGGSSKEGPKLALPAPVLALRSQGQTQL